MGATHVCPGTHLCSAGCDNICPKRNLAVSDAFRNESDGTSVWPQGWGAFVNQQTTHKGMGHFKKGGLDRVVLIATFAPRPEYKRGLETRMLGQGGSYSIKWDHYGHTFSDFVYSETRMTRIKRIMRSFGLLKGNGWNIISVASMRISNNDNGYVAFSIRLFEAFACDHSTSQLHLLLITTMFFLSQNTATTVPTH